MASPLVTAQERQVGSDTTPVRRWVWDADPAPPWPLKPSGAEPKGTSFWISQAAGTEPVIDPPIAETGHSDISCPWSGRRVHSRHLEAALQRPFETEPHWKPVMGKELMAQGSRGQIQQEGNLWDRCPSFFNKYRGEGD